MKNFLFLIVACFLSSCESDSGNDILNPNENPDTLIEAEKAGTVEFFNEDKVSPGVILVNDASGNRVYLMNKGESEILNEWELPSGIGNDAELLENGNLLVALTDPDPAYNFGGFGGRIAIISPSNKILWDYKYSDEINLAHHDLEMLPNGNILFIAWEKRLPTDLVLAGYNGGDEYIYAEKLIEINPNTKEIEWEWNSWDHLIQDADPNAKDFGVVSDKPERINLNYKDYLKEGSYNGDIFHANGLEYDEKKDVIYLSVNFFSEVWVIDHSTTIVEAQSSTGGNFNRGGDLIYRFGNPAAYNNVEGERILFHNHHPNLVPESNNILIFANGIPLLDPHSVVYELELPESFELKPDQNNELNVIWKFADPDLFSSKVSGAQRLENGNTLITEGVSGYWEVTKVGEVVWRFEGDGFFWRGYHYQLGNPAIQNLNLNLED